jgi:hypothetical protein
VKHCTLTPHVKAADFTSLIFLSEDAALLRTECVAMQRTRRRIAGKNSETNLASMLLGWDGKGAARSARKKQPLKN